MLEILWKLFDTSDFPARWNCGRWTLEHGWLYIASDAAIFGAYTAIPILLAWFVLRRRDAPFPRVFWLFIAFILACGVTHLLDAVIFWYPVYRLSAVARLVTAMVSWGTVIALVPSLPVALSLKTPRDLEEEVQARTRELRDAERRLQAAHDELEARVEERTAALQASNEDLKQFAYIVSHDLREPLRMMSMFSELLLDESADALDEDGTLYASRIRDASQRMRAQLDSVAAYSRVERMGQPFERVPLSAALAAARADLELRISETGALIEVEREPLPAVLGDPSQLEQLFANLLANAIKFTPSERAPHITLRAAREGESWRIEVQDRGVGFDMEAAGRIFQIFQRVRPEGVVDGTGVGLAICKRIVVRHGGRIGVTSQPGVGSTFWFTLPARASEGP